MSQGTETVDAPRNWVKGLAASGTVRMVVLPFSAVCALLTARITIETTGVGIYGYINTVAMLFQLLPFADLGVGATMSTAVARRNATADGPERMYAALLGSLRVLAVVAGVSTVAVYVVVYSGLLTALLGLPPEAAENGQLPMFLALGGFFLSVPLSMGFRMLIGLGRTTLIATGTLIAPVTTLVFTWMVSLTDAPPLLFAVGPALGLILTNLFSMVCGLRILGLAGSRLLTDLPRFRRRPGGKVMDTAWPMVVIITMFSLTLFSHRVLLANFSTPTELAVYALTVQLFLPAWSVVYMSGTILWSEFEVSENKRRTLTMANALLVSISVCGALGLYLVGPLVVGLMNPDDPLPSVAPLLAFGVLMVVRALDLAPTMLLVSAAQLRTRALWAGASTVVFAALCVPVVKAGGDVGIILFTAGVGLVFQAVPNLVTGYRAVRTPPRAPAPAAFSVASPRDR